MVNIDNAPCETVPVMLTPKEYFEPPASINTSLAVNSLLHRITMQSSQDLTAEMMLLEHPELRFALKDLKPDAVVGKTYGEEPIEDRVSVQVNTYNPTGIELLNRTFVAFRHARSEPPGNVIAELRLKQVSRKSAMQMLVNVVDTGELELSGEIEKNERAKGVTAETRAFARQWGAAGAVRTYEQTNPGSKAVFDFSAPEHVAQCVRRSLEVISSRP